MRLAHSLLVSGASLAACAFLACTSSKPEQPAAAAPAAPAATNLIQGSVLEVLPAPPYTYLRLKAAQGEVWAAVPAADLKVGAAVTVQSQLRMEKFESKALNRTFDAVYMGTLAGGTPAPAPAAPAPAAANPHGAAPAPAGPHGATPFAGVEKVAKAAGPDAHIISEVYARRAALKDRTVAVRGKVLKSMSGIMGKTWIHLGDGSGQPQAKDYDLVVTTAEAVKAGEVVTVKGVLHLDRDFGSGYVYPVIVEDAKISR